MLVCNAQHKHEYKNNTTEVLIKKMRKHLTLTIDTLKRL